MISFKCSNKPHNLVLMALLLDALINARYISKESVVNVLKKKSAFVENGENV